MNIEFIICVVFVFFVETYEHFSPNITMPVHHFPSSSQHFGHKLHKNAHPNGNQVPFDTTIHGVYLKDLAASIGTSLQDVSNRELRVPVMQEMYDSLEFVPIDEDNQQRVSAIADKITAKLNEVFQILNASKSVIEARYSEMFHNEKLNSVVFPCSHIPSTYLWESYNKFYVKNDSMSYVQYFPSNIKQNAEFNLSQVFAEFLAKASHGGSSGIKQIYFLSSSDTDTTSSSFEHKHCTLYDNTPIWKEYITRIDPWPKNLLILLDHGNALSGHQLYLAKAMAKSLIQMLKPNDAVSVIAIAETYSTPYMIDQCSSAFKNESSFVPASEFNKNRIYNFIESISKSKKITNHSFGFQQAFQTIRSYSNLVADMGPVLLVYISRGLLSSLTEAKSVLETIGREGLDIPVPVYINTCPVIDETKPLMYEKHFLTDVALLNFTKYHLNFNDSLEDSSLSKGIVQSINSVYNLGLVSARFFSTILTSDEGFEQDVAISTPNCDPVSKGSIDTRILSDP